MTGLVLSGGGIRGSYEIGAYYAFKKCGIRFNGIVGTSIGALNGAMLVCKKEKELLNWWKTADTSMILGLEKEFTDLIKKKKINKNLFKGIKDIINLGGIKTDGLRKLLDDMFTEEEVRKSKIDYGLATFQIKSFKQIEIFKNEIPNGKLKDYIIASCYLPVFKQEKIIDDNFYFDGGLFNNTPVSMLVDKGYKKIYAINLGGFNFSKKVENPNNVEIIYITPSKKLGGVLELDEKVKLRNINLGYHDTLKVLKNYDGYDYIFRGKSEGFYNLITKNVSTKELEDITKKFKAGSFKEIVLKSLEELMKENDFEKNKVYNIFYVIKKLKKLKGDNFLNQFVKKLR